MKFSSSLFILWCLFCGFYLHFYLSTGFIFGKSDVENYLMMESTNLPINSDIFSWLNLRHVFISSFLHLFGPVWLCILIPTVYFYGIVYPLYLLFGVKRVLTFVFATASIGLFFVVALWSQFISIAFMVWSYYFLVHGKDDPSFLFFLLAVTYLPSIYFLTYFVSFNLWVIVSFILVFVQPWFFDQTSDWNPIYGPIFYICPFIFLNGLRSWTNQFKGFFTLASFTHLGRLLIFSLPLYELDLKPLRTRIFVGCWFILSNGIILLGYFIE